MTTILVVDDDPHIRELVRALLLREGFQVIEAVDGLDALAKLETVKAEMAILDVMMPNMDGWVLCAELRKYYEFPLLMLTAKGETTHKVRGFETGADDYLVKPFEPAELLVRVKALLKRYRINSSQQIRVAELFMDQGTCQAMLNNETLILPLKEFELLYKLAGHAGRTLTREQLIEDIWGYDFNGNERTLDVHINRLRDRFADLPVSFKINTVRGLGYRLEL